MTKLEQVARAAYEAECRWSDPTERSVPWDEIGAGWKARQMAGIRAAIEELREPTEAMKLSAACTVGEPSRDFVWITPDGAESVYRTMIDAILSEKTE